MLLVFSDSTRLETIRLKKLLEVIGFQLSLFAKKHKNSYQIGSNTFEYPGVDRGASSSYNIDYIAKNGICVCRTT